MGGFPMIIYGRFWVFTEEPSDVRQLPRLISCLARLPASANAAL